MRRRTDIERVKQEGRRFHTPLFNLVSCPSSEEHPRVCIIVGGRFGAAVVRNRAKRVFRELARHCRRDLAGKRAFLVFPRRQALEVSFARLREVWIAALRHEGLLVSRSRLECDSSVSG